MNTDFLKKLTGRQKNLLIIGVFGVLVLLLYGNTLFNGFVFDDHQQVRDNEYVHSLRYISKVLTGCIWEYAVGECRDSVAYYRPIQSLSYLLTYQISSSPWIFHLVNLVYFWAAVYLVYKVGQALSKNTAISLGAALIFLVHPMQTEVVVWVSAVPELTFAIFTLLSLLFYVWFRRQGLVAGSWWVRYRSLLAALGFYILAILSKEPAALLLLFFVFFDVFLAGVPKGKLFQWQHWKHYGAFFLILFFYGLTRVAVFGGHVFGQVEDYGPFTLAERFYAFVTLFAQYLGKFAYPYPLLFFYSFWQSSDFSSPAFLISFAAVLLFFAAAALLVLKFRRPLLAFYLLWIFAFLLPVLLFLNHVGENIFSERYLFVPMAGFALLASTGVFLAWQRWNQWRIPLAIALSLVFAISAGSVIARNGDWKDNYALYTDTLEKNPYAHSVRFNFGVLLRNERNDFEAAKVQFEKIIELDPEWGDATLTYMHIGDYWRDVKRDEQKAVEYYTKSAEAAPIPERAFLAYGRLGALYAEKGEYLQALPFFCKAVQVNPDTESTQRNFERITSVLTSAYQEDPSAIYRAMVTEKLYAPEEEQAVTYKERECGGQTCSFLFSFDARKAGAPILPFLLLGVDSSSRVVKVLDSAFNPTRAEATLETESRWASSAITFIFPTCSGTYYNVAAQQ